MDVSRMGQGERIAGVGGVLLFISLFLPWFGDVSGWEGQSTTDLYLLITAAVAIACALGVGLPLAGVTMDGAAALLGGVATVLLLWLILFDFPDGVDRGIGIFLALIASVVIVFGAMQATPNESGSRRS